MTRATLRWILALSYAVAGVFHIVSPDPFLQIMPSGVPAAEAVVFWTGIAELIGAAALAQPYKNTLRKAGAIGLAAYAVCVFPANINHFALDMAREDRGLGLTYHVPRMFAQPIIVWLGLWVGGVTDWPWRRRSA